MSAAKTIITIFWRILQAPAFVLLVVLEPVVRFLLAGLALLGLLFCAFFWLTGAPHFPLWRMLGISAALGLTLAAYYSLCSLFAPKIRP